MRLGKESDRLVEQLFIALWQAHAFSDPLRYLATDLIEFPAGEFDQESVGFFGLTECGGRSNKCSKSTNGPRSQ